MRNFAAALVVMTAGCAFHVQGTAAPGGEPTQVAPNDPANPTTPTNPTDPTTPTNPTPPTDPTAPTPPGTPTPTPPTPAVDAGTPADMKPAPLVAHVGDPCTSDGECTEPGVTCMHSIGHGIGTISLPGGYCSKTCDPKTPCPTGSECIATLDGPFCMNSCPTGGCRSGYACCKEVNTCGLELLCGDGKGPGGP